MDLRWILIGLGAATTSLLTRSAKAPRRVRRRLSCVPIRLIKDALENQLVSVEGRAEPAAATVLAPMSAKPCLHYLLVVSTPRAFGGWHELARESRHVDIFLTDDSGTAAVFLDEAQVEGDLKQDKIPYSAGAIPKPVADLLERCGANLKEYTSALLLIQEQRIEPGVRVIVAGVARWEATQLSASPTYREVSTRLVLRASKDYPLLVATRLGAR